MLLLSPLKVRAIQPSLWTLLPSPVGWCWLGWVWGCLLWSFHPVALRSAGGTTIPCCEFQVLFGRLSPKIKRGLQDPNLLYGDGVIWVHHESAERLGPTMKMLCPWGQLGTLLPEQRLLRAATFLWISAVFFP